MQGRAGSGRGASVSGAGEAASAARSRTQHRRIHRIGGCGLPRWICCGGSAADCVVLEQLSEPAQTVSNYRHGAVGSERLVVDIDVSGGFTA